MFIVKQVLEDSAVIFDTDEEVKDIVSVNFLQKINVSILGVTKPPLDIRAIGINEYIDYLFTVAKINGTPQEIPTNVKGYFCKMIDDELTLCVDSQQVNYGLEQELKIPWGTTAFDVQQFNSLWYGKIVKVTIPSSFVKIPNYAFFKCSTLREVVIPATVHSVGDSAFEDCESLTSVYLGNVKHLGSRAFTYCKSLKSVYLYDYLQTFGDSVFYACTSLENIHMPKYFMGKVGKSMFSHCSSLKKIVLPKKTRSIEEAAFSYCTGLEEVQFGRGLETIQSFVFEGCTSLRELIIPSGVSVIGANAFANCKQLQMVKMPRGEGGVDSSIFYGCVRLKRVKLATGANYPADFFPKNVIVE